MLCSVHLRSHFHFSTDYHPALAPLSWLFGLWESVEAEVTYPSMSPLKYNEIIEFLPTAQPLVEYKSETWHPVKKVKMHCEKGFLRISPDSKKVAFMICHNFGLNELSEGSVENNSLCLESQSISRMSFSKNAKTVKLVRKLTLKEENLYSTVLMETTDHPLQTHLQCRYIKKS